MLTNVHLADARNQASRPVKLLITPLAMSHVFVNKWNCIYSNIVCHFNEGK
jgi:hypothetical protein